MNLADILKTIYSPLQTFTKIGESKVSFLDGLLFFVFIYTLVLGFSYALLSISTYGFEFIIPFLIGIPPILFLSSVSVMGYILSLILGFIEVLFLSILLHGFSKYVNKGKGTFNSVFTCVSLSQIVNIFPLLIIPLITLLSHTRSLYGLIFGIGMFGYLGLTIFWKYLLYAYSIMSTHKLKVSSVIISIILTLVAYLLVFPLISMWFVQAVPSSVLEIGYFGLPRIETGIR